VLLLAGFFVWVCQRSARGLLVYATDAQYRSVHDATAGFASTLLDGLLVAGSAAAAVLVWRLHPRARLASFAMIALYAAMLALSLIQVRSDPLAGRALLAENWRARGVLVTEERLDFAFSEAGQLLVALVAALQVAAAAVLFLFARPHFGPAPARRVVRYEDLPRSEGVVAKVRVDRRGGITLDGEPVSLEALREAFARLRSMQGAVWYYREPGGADAPADVLAVVRAVVDAKLPISISSKQDFSDVVLPDGTTRARE